LLVFSLQSTGVWLKNPGQYIRWEIKAEKAYDVVVYMEDDDGNEFSIVFRTRDDENEYDTSDNDRLVVGIGKEDDYYFDGNNKRIYESKSFTYLTSKHSSENSSITYNFDDDTTINEICIYGEDFKLYSIALADTDYFDDLCWEREARDWGNLWNFENDNGKISDDTDIAFSSSYINVTEKSSSYYYPQYGGLYGGGLYGGGLYGGSYGSGVLSGGSSLYGGGSSLYGGGLYGGSSLYGGSYGAPGTSSGYYGAPGTSSGYYGGRPQYGPYGPVGTYLYGGNGGGLYGSSLYGGYSSPPSSYGNSGYPNWGGPTYPTFSSYGGSGYPNWGGPSYPTFSSYGGSGYPNWGGPSYPTFSSYGGSGYSGWGGPTYGGYNPGWSNW